jgi:hypothetical protein
MPSLVNVRRQQYNAMRVDCMTHVQVVRGSSRGRVKFFIVSCRCLVAVSVCTKNCCTKVVYLSKSYYHTSMCDPILSGASVSPTSQVRSSAMLVLPTMEN